MTGKMFKQFFFTTISLVNDQQIGRFVACILSCVTSISISMEGVSRIHCVIASKKEETSI